MPEADQAIDAADASVEDTSAEDLDADLPSATDAEVNLERVDEDLADLENLLAQTVAEMENESPSEAGPRPTETPEEASGESAEPPSPAEASACATAESEPESDADLPEDEEAAPAGSPEEIDAPPSEHSEALPTPGVVDDEPAARTAEESPSPPEDEPGPGERVAPAPSRTRMFAVRLAHSVAAAGVKVIVVMDAPFARLSPGAKTLLGYVGIATLLVAIATWIVGSFMRPA